MITKQFVRKVLVAGVAVGASPVPTNTKCDQICRASELPIYMSEDDCKQTKVNELLCPPKVGFIEGAFGAVRRKVWTAMDKCNVYQKEVDEYYERGQEYAASMYKYLSEEADQTTKMGAVGMGALTGLVLGLRGGIFRKLLYSGVGAYGMSAVCYPEQTANYTRQAITESRKYATIGYNFAYGGSGAGEGDQALKVDMRSSKDVIQESHKSAHESCHCPVGACLGRHEEK